jgi:hypothetical protein
MSQQCISFPTADKHRLALISHNSTNKNNVIFVLYLLRLHQLKLNSVERSGVLRIGQFIEESGRRLTEDTIRKYVPGFLPGDKAAEACC